MMNKFFLIFAASTVSVIALGLIQFTFANSLDYQASNLSAKDNPCTKLDEEIVKLEKELLFKNKLLARRKQEIEKLPPESTSMKMKLTSDTFVTAAESETTQNWIEAKRIERSKTCLAHNHK